MASALIARLTAAWDTLRQRDVRWVLYGLASVIALGSDAGLFLLLLFAARFRFFKFSRQYAAAECAVGNATNVVFFAERYNAVV